MGIDIDAMLERTREARNIKCPHCGHIYESGGDFEFFAAHVSYHGSEDGPRKDECGSCGETFWVEEDVDRTYETHAQKPK